MNNLLAEIQRDGYCIIDDFIPKNLCEKFKSILDQLPNEYLVQNKAGDFHGANSILAPNILTHAPEFIDLAQDPRILEIADSYFLEGTFPGENNPYQLALMHARAVLEGASDQELHIDSRLCGVTPPLALHCFLYLDDCLEDGAGATRVVPGSHLFHRYSQASDDSDAINIFGKAGTLIVINSNLYHGSSVKNTIGKRWLITLAYSRWWVRQDFAIPYFSEWPRKLTLKEKQLFGFFNYADKNFSTRGIKARGETPTLIPIADD